MDMDIPDYSQRFHVDKYTFLIDPPAIQCIQPYDSIFLIIDELRNIENSIDINLIFPSALSTNDEKNNSFRFNNSYINYSSEKYFFTLDSFIKKNILSSCNDKIDFNRILNLLAISYNIKADGIITNSNTLINNRYDLYNYHRIKIIPINELNDLIEVIAHGNSVYLSTSSTTILFNPDVYYINSHWKCLKYFKLYLKLKTKINNEELLDQLHSCLLTRYPYILYSIENIKYFELHREHYARRSIQSVHSLKIGFYLNTFYFMLYGMLDHLSIIYNIAYSMGLNNKNCGIKNIVYLEKLNSIDNKLWSFLNKCYIKKWIDIISELRHHVAHKVIKIPSTFVEDTIYNSKSDNDIKGYLYYQNDGLYSYKFKEMEDLYIYNWKLNNMKILSPGIITLTDRNNKTYSFDPVISLDRDLMFLHAIIDAFLVRIFRDF